MAPGIALDRGEALCGEPCRDGVHAHLRIDQEMGGIIQDRRAPAVDRQGPPNKAIAKLDGPFRFGVLFDPGMIAEDLETFAIDLAEPAFDRYLPIGMRPEE